MNQNSYKSLDENTIVEKEEVPQASRNGEFIDSFKILLLEYFEKSDLDHFFEVLSDLSRILSDCSNDQLAPLYDFNFLNKLISLYSLENQGKFAVVLNFFSKMMEKSEKLFDFLMSPDLVDLWFKILSDYDANNYPYMVELISSLSDINIEKCFCFSEPILGIAEEQTRENLVIDGNTAHYINNITSLLANEEYRSSINVNQIVFILANYPLEKSSFNYTCKDICRAFMKGIDLEIPEFISCYYEGGMHDRFVTMMYDESRMILQLGLEMVTKTMHLDSPEDIASYEYIELSRVKTIFLMKINSTKIAVLDFLIKYLDLCTDMQIAQFYEEPEPFIIDLINSLDSDMYVLTQRISLVLGKIFARSTSDMLKSIDFPRTLQNIIGFLDPTKVEFTLCVLKSIYDCLRVVSMAGLIEEVISRVNFESFDELEDINDEMDAILQNIHSFFE